MGGKLMGGLAVREQCCGGVGGLMSDSSSQSERPFLMHSNELGCCRRDRFPL